MALFPQDQLEAIANALGDTDTGLTGPEIELFLASARMNDPGKITKRIRIYNAFVESQNAKRNRTHVLEFIRLAMKPARYSRSPERFEPMRAIVNQALAFASLMVDQAGILFQQRRCRPYQRLSAERGNFVRTLKVEGSIQTF